MQTIWITGAAGGIGAALLEELSGDTAYKVIGTDKDVDITDLAEVKKAMDIYKPQVVINCAAMSDAAACEEDVVKAYKINALGARNLASETRRANAKIIHISTDDVFDANKSGVINEFDTPTPKSVYGKSKLAGENYVRELNPKHIILRSSWVYGHSDSDFFSKVISAGRKNEVITVAKDHVGTPTPVYKVANLIRVLIESSEYGIYHASCEGSCTRKEFAMKVLELTGYNKELISEEESEPSCTVLENLMLKMTDLYQMPEWKSALNEYITVMKGNN